MNKVKCVKVPDCPWDDFTIGKWYEVETDSDGDDLIVDDNGEDYIVRREFFEYGLTTEEKDQYSTLRQILDDAFEQAANGKGKTRHANGEDWTEQPIFKIAELVGNGFQAGQAVKKIQESLGMEQRGEREAAYHECLGAINYIAALALFLRDGKSETRSEKG